MENCQVGLFKLPGLKFEKGALPLELTEEMDAWCQTNNCGTKLSEWLWSFKTEAHREWFILRWNDALRAVIKNQD